MFCWVSQWSLCAPSHPLQPSNPPSSPALLSSYIHFYLKVAAALGIPGLPKWRLLMVNIMLWHTLRFTSPANHNFLDVRYIHTLSSLGTVNLIIDRSTDKHIDISTYANTYMHLYLVDAVRRTRKETFPLGSHSAPTHTKNVFST